MPDFWAVLLSMLLAVSTRADETGDMLESCQNYWNEIKTKDGLKPSRAVMYWPDETFEAKLMNESPNGQAVYIVKGLQRKPFLARKLIMNGSLDTGLFHSDLKTISFDYGLSKNDKKEKLIIRLYFRPKSQSKSLNIIQIPVFENVPNGDLVKNNGKLYQYLQQINPQEMDRCKHNLGWVKGILQNRDETPKVILKLEEERKWKIRTYFTDCQYVPIGSLRSFAQRFKWTNGD